MSDDTTQSSEVTATERVLHNGCHDIQHDFVSLCDVNGLGRGVFAKVFLQIGTELWNEKAMTVAPSRKMLVRRVDADLAKHAIFCWADDTESPGEGIVRCNHYDLGACGAMLFERTSMINHSCTPNASVRMGVSEFGACRARVTVVKPVQAGEQILITYSAANLFRPRNERRAFFSRWGFSCVCPRCEGTLAAVDADMWALFEEAATAADAARQRPRLADAHTVYLQCRAAGMMHRWCPLLFEGERFAEDATLFREAAPKAAPA